MEVVAARGLAASDRDGSANSYVKLTHGLTSCQTQVVSKSLSPTFYHKCVLPLDHRAQTLMVECLNFDCLRGLDDRYVFRISELTWLASKVLSMHGATRGSDVQAHLPF